MLFADLFCILPPALPRRLTRSLIVAYAMVIVSTLVAPMTLIQSVALPSLIAAGMALERPASLGSVILALMAFLLIEAAKLLAFWFTSSTFDNSHVFGLAMRNLGLASSDDFNTLIYMTGTEFRAMQGWMISLILKCGAPVAAGITCILWGVRVFTDGNTPPQARSTTPNDTNHITDSQSSASKIGTSTYCEFRTPVHYNLHYLLIMTLAFSLLSAMVSRLRVLSIPFMCVLGSLTVSHNIQPRTRYGRRFRMGRFLIPILTLIYLFPYGELTVDSPSIDPQPTWAKRDLINHINMHVPNTSILADMPTSALLRLTTSSSIVIHPQFERVDNRNKVQLSYAIGGCASIAGLHDIMRTLDAMVMVISLRRCIVEHSGASSTTPYRDIIQSLQSQYRCPNKYTHSYDRYVPINIHIHMIGYVGMSSVIYLIPHPMIL
eukprot:GHVO01011705.1.p1 GENE.GHVO01011705.1~~GHVO01011705.1.p1  ORF type:complete len:435 (+),score=45.84 GHVO01011705.1:1-1305(+)